MTIAETTFVLLDSETSGLDDGADLLEVAARRVGTDEVFATLVRPTKPIPPEASAIHHLVDADFADAPDRVDALRDLEAWVGASSLVVAHNAPFDRGMIAPALAQNRWLCSERLAHHLVPDAPNFKLGTLYYALGGTKIETALHRAEADLSPTEFVFFELLGLYTEWAAEKCAGDAVRLAKSAEIDSLLAFAERPYVIKRWPMGPDDAKGKPLAVIDDGLLKWALKKDLGSDLRWNVERELKRRGAAA